ncbi:KTSC domain-containing protein [Methylobacterium sp. SD274]|uniref:KTSC domain-containing protein n=1 Tax=Methylobacterium sp. SD274 TaxID=2782009 RepID=UPI001A97CE41|nr:KTSC domain-containing protein [Methylobacterium sp. SD274]MBO1021445.1 KTSC domain-containing protein [Methylobacterium sp. SD274]
MSFVKTNGVDFNSTNIERVEYDSGAKTLKVSFIGGKTYQYDDIDSCAADSFESADSKTRFLNESIARRFAVLPLEPSE